MLFLLNFIGLFSTLIFFNNIFASYSHLPTINDINATRTDEALVEFAYRNTVYNNVGRLSYLNNIKDDNGSMTYTEYGYGSAAYIGSKFCVTAAHCQPPEPLSCYIFFEIPGKQLKPYKVQHFIKHLRSNEYAFDIAILILEEDVKYLEGLKISSEFSCTQIFKEYQHFLTYVGYGIKIYDNLWCCNQWFHKEDRKRRSFQAYTRACTVKADNYRLYSAYYQCNDGKTSRVFTAHESYARSGMSGGAVLNEKNELIATMCHVEAKEPQFSRSYLYFASVMNNLVAMVNTLGCSIPLFNTFSGANRGSRTCSVLLAPFKDWIEEVRTQYDNTYV